MKSFFKLCDILFVLLFVLFAINTLLLAVAVPEVASKTPLGAQGSMLICTGCYIAAKIQVD